MGENFSCICFLCPNFRFKISVCQREAEGAGRHSTAAELFDFDDGHVVERVGGNRKYVITASRNGTCGKQTVARQRVVNGFPAFNQRDCAVYRAEVADKRIGSRERKPLRRINVSRLGFAMP